MSWKKFSHDTRFRCLVIFHALGEGTKTECTTTEICRINATYVDMNTTNSEFPCECKEEYGCKDGKTTFALEGVRQCYCLEQFRNVLNVKGVWQGTQDFVASDQADCSDVIIFFGMSKSIIFVAVAVVSFFNIIIQSSASYFVKNVEQHPNVTAVTDSQIMKTFLGLFVNTALEHLLIAAVPQPTCLFSPGPPDLKATRRLRQICFPASRNIHREHSDPHPIDPLYYLVHRLTFSTF